MSIREPIYVTCCVSPFSHGHMAATRVCSSPYPFHCPSWTRSLRVTHELRGRQPQWLCSEFVPFLLLFDCQEAFHCCLVVTCINRINMISIQCHRVGEWWSGKPEFENVSDPAGVYIPFNHQPETPMQPLLYKAHYLGSGRMTFNSEKTSTPLYQAYTNHYWLHQAINLT